MGNLCPGLTTAPMTFFLHSRPHSLPCDHHLCAFPALLPLVRKCTSVLFSQHTANEPVLSSDQQCLDFLGVVFTTVLLYWGGFVVFKRAKRPYFASVVSKGSQPSKRPSSFPKAHSVNQKLHPGCRDCTNPCSCTVLTIKTTFKTLLVIKKKKHLYLFF